MTVMARFGGILFLFVAVLQFVAARPGQPDPSSCQPNEFWFDGKNCCLPLGGPDSHPTPPAQKQCPSSGWSWSDEHDCCIPHSPRPRPPRCSQDWDWEPTSLCCQPHQPSHPKPSGGAGNWKRALHSPLSQLCPMGLRACPISGASTLSGDYECLDTTNELESCGGCASTGEGQDCTAIKGAWNVGCERGTCAVYTCAAGFKRSGDGNSCVTI